MIGAPVGVDDEVGDEIRTRRLDQDVDALGGTGPAFGIADDPAYASEVRKLTGVLQEWIEQSGDFPAEYRVRDDNTDRLTGVQFTTKIPPLRNVDVAPPSKRWGRPGPS